MVRVSYARMSGTSYGAAALRCSPKADFGEPLAWVREGDSVELKVAERRIDLEVGPVELQAGDGADLDYL